MNILVLGSGGREHTLAEMYSKNTRVKKVFVLPGNGLMDFENEKVSMFQNIKTLDFAAVSELIKKEKIDLVDVAQDDPLAAGFVDKLEKKGIAAFGPTQKASEIEWSKDWARSFMTKYKLPIPRFETFTNQRDAVEYVNSLYRHPRLDQGSMDSRFRGNDNIIVFIKASGLAGGKGAIRAENKKEAIAAIEQMSQFGKAGETFLIEECLVGEEFSLFAICDGKDYQIVGWAQDHKTVYDGDLGPNTGGMGCVAPAGVVDQKILKEVEAKILKPFMIGMQKEKRPYEGILYLGGMLTKQGIKIIEFNARWGDPEAEVILPSIKTDYLRIIEAVLSKKLKKVKIRFDGKVRISVAGCSKGYPGDYARVKGKEIFGLEQAITLPGITIYGAGIKREGGRFFANGGRVFHLVAQGETIVQARVRAYGAMAMIRIEGDNLHYRSDIGWRDVERIIGKSL